MLHVSVLRIFVVVVNLVPCLWLLPRVHFWHIQPVDQYLIIFRVNLKPSFLAGEPTDVVIDPFDSFISLSPRFARRAATSMENLPLAAKKS